MEYYDFNEIDSEYYTTSEVKLKTTQYVTKEKYDRLRTALRGLVEAAKEMIAPVPLEYIGLSDAGRYKWNAICAKKLKDAIAAAEAAERGEVT